MADKLAAALHGTAPGIVDDQIEAFTAAVNAFSASKPETYGIRPNDKVKIGNSPEVFRVHEFVNRTGDGRLVANLYSVATKESRNGVNPVELLFVEHGILDPKWAAA